MSDEPLDIRELTEENLEEIAELTRRPIKTLRQELLHAHNVNRKVYVLVNNPIIRPRTRKRLQDCDYDTTWSAKVGWVHICAVHHKPSWHNIAENPHAPCIAIDPKPDDV
jgi:hypothetical protein